MLASKFSVWTKSVYSKPKNFGVDLFEIFWNIEDCYVFYKKFWDKNPLAMVFRTYYMISVKVLFLKSNLFGFRVCMITKHLYK